MIFAHLWQLTGASQQQRLQKQNKRSRKWDGETKIGNRKRVQSFGIGSRFGADDTETDKSSSRGNSAQNFRRICLGPIFPWSRSIQFRFVSVKKRVSWSSSDSKSLFPSCWLAGWTTVVVDNSFSMSQPSLSSSINYVKLCHHYWYVPVVACLKDSVFFLELTEQI